MASPLNADFLDKIPDRLANIPERWRASAQTATEGWNQTGSVLVLLADLNYKRKNTIAGSNIYHTVIDLYGSPATVAN